MDKGLWWIGCQNASAADHCLRNRPTQGGIGCFTLASRIEARQEHTLHKPASPMDRPTRNRTPDQLNAPRWSSRMSRLGAGALALSTLALAGLALREWRA